MQLASARCTPKALSTGKTQALMSRPRPCQVRPQALMSIGHGLSGSKTQRSQNTGVLERSLLDRQTFWNKAFGTKRSRCSPRSQLRSPVPAEELTAIDAATAPSAASSWRLRPARPCTCHLAGGDWRAPGDPLGPLVT